MRQQGWNLHWRIIGPFHPETNAYHFELARCFNVPWVEFTGGFHDIHDQNLRTLIAETDVMILPFADGASLRRTSLQAAWAFSLPVITTSPTAQEPDIQNRVNCLLIQESTPLAWSEALKEVLQNYQLKEQLRFGSLRTSQHFSWEKLA